MSFSTKNFLTLSLCLFTLLASAQTTNPKKSSPESTVIQGCQYEEDVYECSKEKLRRSIFEILKPSDAMLIAKSTKKDIIFVNAIFATDSVGNIDKKISSLKFHETEMNPIDVEIATSPEDFQIELAPISKMQDTYIRNHLFLKIDRKNNVFIPLYDHKPERIPFSGPEVGIVYSGCKGAKTNEERQLCMGKKISEFVAKNFNTKVGKKLDLKGIQRIYVVFKVNTIGKVIDIRSRAPHPDLEKEAIRVVRRLPRMQPALIENTPINVTYTLPIVFNMDDKKPKERKRRKW